LLQKGLANAEATEKYGYTALHLACQSGCLDLIKCLVLDGNANVEATDSGGWRPLHHATVRPQQFPERHDCLEIVKFLVLRGQANIVATADYGVTALYFAGMANHLEMFLFLVEQIPDLIA
jgi:ankyrin repeat protein